MPRKTAAKSAARKPVRKIDAPAPATLAALTSALVTINGRLEALESAAIPLPPESSRQVLAPKAAAPEPDVAAIPRGEEPAARPLGYAFDAPDSGVGPIRRPIQQALFEQMQAVDRLTSALELLLARTEPVRAEVEWAPSRVESVMAGGAVLADIDANTTNIKDLTAMVDSITDALSC